MRERCIVFLVPRPGRGFGLLEVLVAAVILSIVMGGFLMLMRRQSVSTAQVRQRGELEDIRRLVRLVLDCPSTVGRHASPCPNGTEILLYNDADQPIMPRVPGTNRMRSGNYEVRVTCTSVPGRYRTQWRVGSSGPWRGLYPKAPPLYCAP